MSRVLAIFGGVIIRETNICLIVNFCLIIKNVFFYKNKKGIIGEMGYGNCFIFGRIWEDEMVLRVGKW